ncbi:MAG: hypothetical protein PHC33_02465 [Candidatus Omnitrophica bacterium]|nr:hypothetical protein [Candidatus Omnitrophota bacterium]
MTVTCALAKTKGYNTLIEKDKMMRRAQRTKPKIEYRNDEYYRQAYGKDAVIVRLGYITIIHLDHPDKDTIRKRTEEVMREEITGEAFDDDCPLCQEMKNHPHEVVYYGQD